MKQKIVCTLASVLLLAGCPTIPPKAGFDSAQQTVAAGTDEKIYWTQDAQAHRQVQDAIDDLLKKPLSAADAVQIALLNNQDLQASYEQLDVSEADLVEAGLLTNPVFSFSIGFSGRPYYTVDAGIEQTFVDLLLMSARKKIAEAQFKATQAQVTAMVVSFAGRVRESYYNLQGDMQMVDLLNTAAAAENASLEAVRLLYKAGNIQEIDYDEQLDLYEQAKLAVAQAQAQVLQDREELNILMGLWGDRTGWNISNRLPDPPEQEVSLDGLEALAIPIPIFNQGQPDAAYTAAEYRAAEDRYDAQVAQIHAEVQEAWNALMAARQEAEFYQKVLIPLRQSIVEQTQLAYNGMYVGVFDLIAAKKNQIDAGREYIQALKQYWIAREKLRNVLSGELPAAGSSGSAVQPAISQ